MLWYSIILAAASVGIISLIMSYDQMKRSSLILCILSILPAIGVFIKMGVSRETFSEAAMHFALPGMKENLHIYIVGMIIIIGGLLYREGTIHWLWRRVHPSSAPTEGIGAGQRGHVSRQGSKMSSGLMGTSTAMFSVPGLDVKTVALIRLSFFAFRKVNQKTVIGIESFLRLGDGRRYKAFHSIAAEVQHKRVNLTDIVHPYWRAINGNHSSARLMFADLCQIARATGNTDKKTINNIVKIGQALGLSPQDMGVAIGKMRG